MTVQPLASTEAGGDVRPDRARTAWKAAMNLGDGAAAGTVPGARQERFTRHLLEVHLQLLAGPGDALHHHVAIQDYQRAILLNSPTMTAGLRARSERLSVDPR